MLYSGVKFCILHCCFFCFVCKTMARYYPPCLESPALFFVDPLSGCNSSSSSSRSSSRSTTASAGAIFSSSSNTHLPSAISLAAASRERTGMYHARKLALFSRLVYRVGREYKEQYNNHIRNIKIPYQRTLYFCTERNCEHIRNVCLASSGTVIAAQNRVHLANARRGPDLLDYEG